MVIGAPSNVVMSRPIVSSLSPAQGMANMFRGYLGAMEPDCVVLPARLSGGRSETFDNNLFGRGVSE